MIGGIEMATKKVQKIEKIHNTQKPGKLRFDNTRGTSKQRFIIKRK
jgi:hypothetical protein